LDEAESELCVNWVIKSPLIDVTKSSIVRPIVVAYTDTALFHDRIKIISKSPIPNAAPARRPSWIVSEARTGVAPLITSTVPANAASGGWKSERRLPRPMNPIESDERVCDERDAPTGSVHPVISASDKTSVIFGPAVEKLSANIRVTERSSVIS
jgi:hypothetical protein